MVSILTVPSSRHAFVVYGGKGSDGKALSDVWVRFPDVGSFG